MEKEDYETYEYLPASGSNSEAEPYQFFVVQDDGTFLINRQVQYVTQVQDVKEVLEGERDCTMLDVAQQQFYVDVDTTTEMISVPEQFSIPEATNNLYTSSYLLQSGTEAPVEQTNNSIEQLKSDPGEENSLPCPNKQGGSLTEITLTDEQYHVLEQKGWILLETNEKVYVLDTLGLHDITTNDKLIQKLKIEETTTDLEPECKMKIEYPPSLGEIDVEIASCVQDESKMETPLGMEYASELPLVVDDTKSKEDSTQQKLEWQEKETSPTDELHADLEDNLYKGVSEQWKDGNVLRIRTDFCLKDIPDKIVLGKTKNGKRLVCKVLKPDKNVAKQSPNTKGKINPITTSTITVQNNIPSHLIDVDDRELDTIFRKCFEDDVARCTINDIAAAEKVVKQLLRFPAVKPSLVNRNILVTKVILNQTDSSIVQSWPKLVTGNVALFHKEWRLVHKSELYAIAKKELSEAQSEMNTDHNFLHIHIHEIQRDGKVTRMAVTLNKRRLELDATHSEKIYIPDFPLHMAPEVGKQNTIYGYACGTCASIFQSEKELNVHQESHKADTDDKLTIDTEEGNRTKVGIVVLTDTYNKNKTFACMQCNAKFQKMSNCQRHVKMHMTPANTASSTDKNKVYKCKICHSFFHHASTLFKHIKKSHIQIDK